MSVRTRILSALAAGLLTAATGVALSGPAQAASYHCRDVGINGSNQAYATGCYVETGTIQLVAECSYGPWQ